MITVGSVCIVTAGRHAGKKIVVTGVIDDIFVKGVGKNIKERKFNKRHLLPTGEKVDPKKFLEEMA